MATKFTSSGSDSSARTSRSSSHDRTTVPRCHALITDGTSVIKVSSLQQLESLRIGLHQPVLDAVVHHFREVPSPDRAGMREPLLARAVWTQRVEDRHGTLDVLGLASDHQAVAVVQAPYAAGDPAVQITDPLGVQHLGIRLVVGVSRVAAIDHQVARGQQIGELTDSLLVGSPAGTITHTVRGASQPANQIRE